MSFSPRGSAKWRQLIVSLKMACVAQYSPEYYHDNDRSLNHRYYR